MKNFNSKNLNFVHLRTYSEYSINKGFIKIDELIKFGLKNNIKYLSLTDVNNIFGSVEFYNKCISNKIKPIIGCELSIKNKYNKDFKILLIVKNNIGYENLSKLISKGNIYNKKFELNYEIFKNLNKGLILITGSINSEIGYFLNENNLKLSKYYINFWKKCFKNDIYFEIQNYDLKCNYLNNKILEFSNLYKIPVLITNPIFFLKKKDFLAYKIKLSINKIKIKSNFRNFFFYKNKKIKSLFNNYLNLISNSINIAKICNLFFNFNKLKLPFYKNNKIINNNKYLLKLSFKKLNKRFFINKINLDNYNIYEKRLIKEIKIIIKMGFSDYFLLVNNFIKWSYKNKISYGPGRGSSSGSLVSFCLFINNIDPIKNNLLFERFLNIKKLSIPDFDIDFCKNDRLKVFNYLKLKFGICNICNIITFGKLVSKASFRNVGKSLKFNYNFINNISRFFYLNKKIKTIIKNNEYLKYNYKNDFKFKKLINLSIKIEGLIKSVSVHAAGIVIFSNKIYNFFPIIIKKNYITSHFYKNYIELLGFLKFDFLILITLSILSKVIKIIKFNYNINFYLNNVNINNKECYKILYKENPVTIFQFESEGMKNMLLKAKPENFNNLISLISLYRPGPIKLLNLFCLRKNSKKKIYYFNDILKKILKETYGVIIYQEQIMLIFKNISKYSLNKADILRKILNKKNNKEIIKEKINFIKKSSLNKVNSLKLFNDILKFSGYSFNKSHATSYALLSYYTLWLKKNYFLEFITINISYFFYDHEKLKSIINFFKNKNIYLLPLNINFSKNNFIFSIEKYNKIRYGFSSIKGLGESLINEILLLRKEKFFKNFFDFVIRINKKSINYKSLEILISVGCFDSFDKNKSYLLKFLIFFKKNFDLYLKYNYLNSIFKNFLLNSYIKNFWNIKINLIEEKFSLNYFKKNFLIFYKKKFFFFLKNKKIKNLKFKFGILIENNYKFFNKKKIYFIKIIYKNKIYFLNFYENFYKKIKNIIKKFKFFIFKYDKNKKLINNNKIYYLLTFIFNFNLLKKYVKNKIK